MEPLALEARLALQELVLNKTILIETGQQARDRHGRLLAYVFLADGTDVQEKLLGKGYAMMVAIPPNIRYLESYLAAEETARRSNKGLWRMNWFKPVDLTTRAKLKAGFRRIAGRVVKVAHTGRHWRLSVNGRLSILIRESDWMRYWRGEPHRLLKKHIEARGWIYKTRRQYRLYISHPAMLVVAE